MRSESAKVPEAVVEACNSPLSVRPQSWGDSITPDFVEQGELRRGIAELIFSREPSALRQTERIQLVVSDSGTNLAISGPPEECAVDDRRTIQHGAAAGEAPEDCAGIRIERVHSA